MTASQLLALSKTLTLGQLDIFGLTRRIDGSLYAPPSHAGQTHHHEYPLQGDGGTP
jgi:hypothetical protein